MGIQLKPSLCHIWRNDGGVQFGINPKIGTLIEGLTAVDEPLIENLRRGTNPDTHFTERSLEVISVLRQGGVITRTRSGRARGGDADFSYRARLSAEAANLSLVYGDAQRDGWDLLAARKKRVVQVHGQGSAAMQVAVLLGCAGVGDVRYVDESAVTLADVRPGSATREHVGMTRSHCVEELLRAYGCEQEPTYSNTIDVVVQIDERVADAVSSHQLLRRSIPHLSIVLQEAAALVGPFVVPGQGPCLSCLDHHRTSRDPEWPQVMQEARGHPTRLAQDTVLTSVTASVACAQVLTYLDQVKGPKATHTEHTPDQLPDVHELSPWPVTVGATLEIELPDATMSRRPWPVHNECRCQNVLAAT